MNSIVNRNKVLKIALILLTLVSAHSILAHAEGITMDGCLDEAEWNHWFTDASESPVVDIYYYNDTTNVYIGILTDDTTDNDDVLEFAYRASRRDYWFKLESDGSVWYRSGEEGVEGWWMGIKTGLPPGACAVASMTDGYRSYEISLSLLSMEEKADDFPENFVFWYKVQDGNSGPDNYYPDSRAGWWFVEEDEEEEFIFEFHIPELPMGTITALITMFAAIAIFAKKTSILPIRR